MIGGSGSASRAGRVALLERAITYALGSLRLVTAESLHRPTPCRRWDVAALLAHMNDSLVALHEAATAGGVDLDPAPDEDPGRTDPASALRDRACRLLGEWAGADWPELITISGCPVDTSTVVGAGALEVAVHGWDVAEACGRRRDLPEALAQELLELAPVLITCADRPGRFGGVVTAAANAGPGELLLAFMGRDPDGSPPRSPELGW